MGEIAYVALGSNLGDRRRALARAREAVAALPGTRMIAETPITETAPFGPEGQGPYLNQMLAIETSLAPHELLDALQDIEARAGRVREVRWGPRVLDLDIVRYGDRAVNDERLQVPHPGLRDREFWQQQVALLDGAARD